MNTWQFIIEEKKKGCKVILLYVVNSVGSSPGRQGFKMAVSSTGKMCGSIGGGIMEHKFVEMAKEEMKSGIEKISLQKQVHHKDAGNNKSGMICSGEQTLLFYPIKNEEIGTIERLLHADALYKNGSLKIRNTGIQFLDVAPVSDFYFSQTNYDFSYIEKTGCKYYLHIIGGGHCALALSQLLQDTDFLITVYDDREMLNTMEQNSFAHKMVMLKSYEEISGHIPQVPGNYVVVMTFGYRTDDKVIRALAQRQFEYFGVLGSANKIRQMKSEYENENFSIKMQDNFFAPAGISIHSHTPKEIAISIAAQIIAVKNSKLSLQ